MKHGTQKPIIIVPDYVRAATEALFFRESTRKWKEAVAYWAGVKCADNWVVTTVILPRARTTWGSFSVSAAANAEVVSLLSANKLKLIAQVHTHPGEWAGHSEGDDLGAAMAHENFVSIVVPAYGVGGLRDLKECGVYRFEAAAFRELSREQVRDFVRWVPTEKAL